MTTQEIIKILISIRKDADRLHSGNVAHQRVHMIGDLQWLIDELSKANSSNTRTEPALPIHSVVGRSEQLKAFLRWAENEWMETPPERQWEQMFDEYFKSL